jgi:DNA-binding NarL/FixJ family response regulator
MAAMVDLQVLLVDDHAIFRRGLHALLSEAMPAARLCEAGSLEDALALDIPELNLVLLDIKLPGIGGIDGIALLRQRWPTVRVVILSGLESPEASLEALASGAIAYIPKSESPERILERIKKAIVAEAVKTSVPLQSGHLTQRQREVLDLLSLGLSNKLIARALNLSENTVRRHVQDILDYFCVDSRSEAVFVARRRGIVG